MTGGKRNFVVTIDGPAASGKSTTARLVAKTLGWLYLDTGAMYRALTVKVLRQGMALTDTEEIGRMAEQTTIELAPADEGARVILDGEDVTSEIRRPEVDGAIGPVCEIPKVRQIMVSLQRALGKNGGIIAEGRDMGTVVFPDAELKFYVVASIGERVKRREQDMAKQGITYSRQQLMEEIEKRDHRDQTRRISPLTMADDAILLDTTEMDVAAQVAFVIDRIKQTGGCEETA
jgi:cytidylate kinase